VFERLGQKWKALNADASELKLIDLPPFGEVDRRRKMNGVH
jgi:hypothetical protein